MRAVNVIPFNLTPLQAIRQRCLLCKQFNAENVRQCKYDGTKERLCPLWGMRFGVRPTSRYYPPMAKGEMTPYPVPNSD